MRKETVISPVARTLLASIFVLSGIEKLTHPKNTMQYMKAKNMRFLPPLLAGAIGVEILAGLSLLTGYQTRKGAALLGAYLIPTTYIFHDFWKMEEGMDKQMQRINFMKNLAIIGGLVEVALHGAGELSVDRRLESRQVPGLSERLDDASISEAA